jgi:Ser/Thr protein kinase RdoA (MazF antagonist)
MLLKKLGYPELQFLGEGMQCLVFADGPDQVLKIYDTAVGVKNLERLMAFYQSLDTSSVSFKTPKILSIKSTQDKILVTENRLTGISPSLKYLQQMEVHDLETFFQHYVDVLFEIQNITTDFLQPGEPLDQSGDYCQYDHYGSWQALLSVNIRHKLSVSGKHYTPFVEDLDEIVDKVFTHIKALPQDDNRLVHGDYYPANTLMDENFNITSVLDFGTYTIPGDPLYDIALGWIFADMYQNVKQLRAKDFVGDLIRQRISVEEYRRMKLYILIYSLLSADIYGSSYLEQDGHFRWAMDNLNNKSYREVL